jgi:putative RNA 2'-phosphotransferase
VKPPDVLFHGTVTGFTEAIKKWGLRRGRRLYVHLSPDELSAMNVGRGHGKPTVLIVSALRMNEKGFQFYRSDSGVWLTGDVAPEYITFPGQ